MKKLIAGNWKMNGSVGEVEAFLEGFKNATDQNDILSYADLVVCPPFPLLGKFNSDKIALGAQDCHAKTSGAYTGDVSAGMLKDLGCTYVILGHSERRMGHEEDNKQVQEKVEMALAAGLKIILCIGESLEIYEEGQTLKFLTHQLFESLPKSIDAESLTLAYEPIWAIGTGKVAGPSDILKVHTHLRSMLPNALKGIRILYGGSVKPDNAKEIMSLEGVDGVLVGGASLKFNDYWAIARSANVKDFHDSLIQKRG